MTTLKLTPELIEKYDKLAPSPAALASKVYKAIKDLDLTNQDLQCFCVEYLASQVQTGELLFMEHEVKELNRMYYLSHYYRIECSQLNLNTKKEMDSPPSSMIVEG